MDMVNIGGGYLVDADKIIAVLPYRQSMSARLAKERTYDCTGHRARLSVVILSGLGGTYHLLSKTAPKTLKRRLAAPSSCSSKESDEQDDTQPLNKNDIEFFNDLMEDC